MLENVILGFLMEGNMTGYDIKSFMSISTANFFNASFGSIYPALKRLEDKKNILSRDIVEGGKYKKIYEITEDGKREFFIWMDKPADISAASQEHLMKSFFLNHISKEKAGERISEFINGAQKELGKLEVIGQKISGHTDPYKKSTLEFGKEYYSFVMRWYEGILNRLDEMDAEKNKYENHCIERKS